MDQLILKFKKWLCNKFDHQWEGVIIRENHKSIHKYTCKRCGETYIIND
jgi:hypothetical protein